MDDYLAAEPLIVARLQALVDGVSIRSSWGLPAIEEDVELLPSVIVFLEADQPGESRGVGKSHKVTQTWLCLVVVRDAETQAGPLVSQVITALSGWKPGIAGFSPFLRVPSAYAPDYSPNGIFYFPVAFATSFVFNSEE